MALVLLAIFASNASAQLPNEDYRGVAAAGITLRKLATTKRVLVIGAHPDDEDNQLMTYLSLREGADVAYLALNRGEGGQNSIGSELGPALGVLRSSELVAARRLDEGQQFFTRSLDFGFSKTAEETLQHWPKDSILNDVVAVVRRYRPDVIVAIFSGTPRDGHGHHQVSGMLAREAFVAAADPARFPQQLKLGLRPHKAFKLIQATGYRQADPTEIFPTGEFDELLGRSYAQIAAASRSRHRSQDMGQAQLPGPRSTSIRVLQSNVGGSESSLFSAIDTTLSMRAASAHEAAPIIRAIQSADSMIAAAVQGARVQGSAAMLATVIKQLSSVMPSVRDADLRFTISNEITTAQRALMEAGGIVIDAVTDVEAVLPGATFNLDVSVWNGAMPSVRIAKLEPVLPAGWRAERKDTSTDVVPRGAMVTRRYRVTAPSNAVVSQPYFLNGARPGDYYAWPAAEPFAGEPFDPDPVRVGATLDVSGAELQQVMSATRRVVDPRQGEVRRAVRVAPAFALRPDPLTSVVTLASLSSGTRKALDVNVEVTSNGGAGPVMVTPLLPTGWRSTPEQTSVAMEAGHSALAHFAIQPPPRINAGHYGIRFTAKDSTGRSYELAQRAIDYPHIVNRVIYEPAVLSVTVLDARFARGMRVGYIVGMDAPVPQVLEQMGVSVDRLDANQLANADLAKYDAVVIGSRAYEVRPDLVAHNMRLLDYARAGGNLVVLYQQYEFIDGNYAPFKLTLARPHDRITDENSPVRLLDSTAVALSRPNRIGSEDFKNWVQERALYMPHTWAAEYKPLLEMNDPGEAPLQGGILTAPLGTGRYTYTGIAFFREIPAGVPGALRLFVNLLSQGVKDVAF